MTPEQRKTLLECIAEYGNSLARIEGEKDQMKAIAARAVADLGITAGHFTKLATAYHKDAVPAFAADLAGQYDLLELARGGE
jgi:hypothetical protein